MKFNERLREARKNSGISQPQLAKLVGVSKGTISFWESGRNEPSIAKLNEISKFLNVPVLYLVSDDYVVTEKSVSESEPMSTAQRLLINKVQSMNDLECARLTDYANFILNERQSDTAKKYS